MIDDDKDPDLEKKIGNNNIKINKFGRIPIHLLQDENINKVQHLKSSIATNEIEVKEKKVKTERSSP